MIKGKRHQALFYFGETGHFYFGVTTELRIRDFMLNNKKALTESESLYS